MKPSRLHLEAPHATDIEVTYASDEAQRWHSVAGKDETDTPKDPADGLLRIS